MNWQVLRVLLSHWHRQKGQLLGILLGISLATGLWSGVQAINNEARASYRSVDEITENQGVAQITATRGLTINDYARLRRSGWQVTPMLSEQLTIGKTVYTVVGVDFLAATMPLDFRSPPVIEQITNPSISRRAFANAQTEQTLKGVDFTLSVDNRIPNNRIVMDISMAEELLNLNGQITQFSVLADQPLHRLTLAEIDPMFKLSKSEKTIDIKGLTDSFHLNLTAFGLLAFAVGLFIVRATIGLAFEQRRGTLRTLRAIGVTRSKLTALLLGELLAFALIAGFTGLALGYLIAAALLPDVAATLSGLYGAEVPGVLEFRATWVLAGLAMAIFGTMLAGAQALWHLWHLPILMGAQNRAWALASEKFARWRWFSAVTLGGVGLVFLAFGQGLVANFVSLAGFMLAAATALPSVLSMTVTICERRSNSIKAIWFWADTRQQLPHLSLALTALMLALTINIGVTSMVSSFRLTFVGWLDQRLASELYVQLDDQQDQAAFLEWIAPRVDAVLPLVTAQTTIFGRTTEVQGISASKSYRDNWRFLAMADDPWGELENGRGVLINEQMWRRQDLEIGEAIFVTDNMDLSIVGVYADYGNPLAQVVIAQNLLTRNFTEYNATRVSMRLDPTKVSALPSNIISEFGLPAAAVIDQSALKSTAIGVFDRTFIVSNALNLLTLLVAGLAIVISLATLARIRLTQLAPLWAIGIARANLARLELLRTVALAVFTFAFALPVGLFLTWFLLAVVNVTAFGWRLPLYFFPASWAWLLLVTIAAACIAAALPALQFWRRKPSDFLKVFASES